jgi:hypothetical protein
MTLDKVLLTEVLPPAYRYVLVLFVSLDPYVVLRNTPWSKFSHAHELRRPDSLLTEATSLDTLQSVHGILGHTGLERTVYSLSMLIRQIGTELGN